MLNSTKAFLLRRGHDHAIEQQGGGTVVVEAGYSKNFSHLPFFLGEQAVLLPALTGDPDLFSCCLPGFSML
jgi:hypothetical protein